MMIIVEALAHPSAVVFPNKHQSPSAREQHVGFSGKPPPTPLIWEYALKCFHKHRTNPENLKVNSPPKLQILGRAQVLIRKNQGRGLIAAGKRTQRVWLGEIFIMLIWCMLVVVGEFGFRGSLDMSYEFR